MQIQKKKGGEHEFTFSKNTKGKKSGGFFTCGKTSDLPNKKICSCELSNQDINEICDMALEDKKSNKEFVMKNYFNLNPYNFMKILKSMNNSA